MATPAQNQEERYSNLKTLLAKRRVQTLKVGEQDELISEFKRLQKLARYYPVYKIKDPAEADRVQLTLLAALKKSRLPTQAKAAIFQKTLESRNADAKIKWMAKRIIELNQLHPENIARTVLHMTITTPHLLTIPNFTEWEYPPLPSRREAGKQIFYSIKEIKMGIAQELEKKGYKEQAELIRKWDEPHETKEKIRWITERIIVLNQSKPKNIAKTVLRISLLQGNFLGIPGFPEWVLPTHPIKKESGKFIFYSIKEVREAIAKELEAREGGKYKGAAQLIRDKLEWKSEHRNAAENIHRWDEPKKANAKIMWIAKRIIELNQSNPRDIAETVLRISSLSGSYLKIPGFPKWLTPHRPSKTEREKTIFYPMREVKVGIAHVLEKKGYAEQAEVIRKWDEPREANAKINWMTERIIELNQSRPEKIAETVLNMARYGGYLRVPGFPEYIIPTCPGTFKAEKVTYYLIKDVREGIARALEERGRKDAAEIIRANLSKMKSPYRLSLGIEKLKEALGR